MTQYVTMEQIVAFDFNKNQLYQAYDLKSNPKYNQYYLSERYGNWQSYNRTNPPSKPVLLALNPSFFVAKENPAKNDYDEEYVNNDFDEEEEDDDSSLAMVRESSSVTENKGSLENETILDFDVSLRNLFNHYGDELNVVAKIEIDGSVAALIIPIGIAVKYYGFKINRKFEVEFQGIRREIKNWEKLFKKQEHRYYYEDRKWIDYSLGLVSSFYHGAFMGFTDDVVKTLLLGGIDNGFPQVEVEGSGIQKTLSKCLPWIEEIKSEDPEAFCFARSIIDASSRTIEGVKVSTVVNETFSKANSKEELLALLKLRESIENPYERYNIESCLKALPAWHDKRKAVLKSQGNRAFVKLMSEYESLNLDEKLYPKTAKAVKSGELQLTTFFRKNEQYFLLNDNWSLWEKMLSKHRDITIELANTVKGRTTYEKDLMSYFYFVLYALPKYLNKHTGYKWTCIPKLVNTQQELEPPTADNNGVARKRSALTPIVDNENKTVTVPYASLAIPGRQTTYCYGLDYHVLTEGFSFNGNVVSSEIEKKLNGRDDYGLMFYTLTGSSQGRGYPTFLIIFERRSEDTIVHFHRTHPSRSKDGDYNPIHNWIRVCYNWMAGNINKSLIKAQQGDLVFVETDKEVKFEKTVDSYDKHCFDRPVGFAEGPEKSNILCYVNVAEETLLRHTEHENVPVPAGRYAIHQCRSWEANPKGVWSLRID